MVWHIAVVVCLPVQHRAAGLQPHNNTPLALGSSFEETATELVPGTGAGMLVPYTADALLVIAEVLETTN